MTPILRRLSRAAALAAAAGLVAGACAPGAHGTRAEISFSTVQSAEPLDGRLLLLVSSDPSAEPRFQITDGPETQVAFGLDVDGLAPGQSATIDGSVYGYPIDNVDDLPAGTYTVQALLHRYETFHRGDGHTVKLPMDRGEGQQWNLAPGNLYSTPQQVTLDPARGGVISIALDQVIPAIPDPPETKYIRHEKIQSQLLSDFWGRPMFIGAHVLVPAGFDEHPDAHYPLVIDQGHFPYTFEGFREEPPDPDLKCEYSERFHLDCYNRIEQERAYQFYEDWTGPGFPRFILIQIQHANPYYDDSYAVNSENLGPYGDAIVKELIPHIEQKYRGIGQGWARFMYGGSTGGWETLAAQVFYPDTFNGAFAACPDPIDFRAYTVVNLYDDKNAYDLDSPWKRTPRPGHRDYLGHVSATLEEMNRRELVLGDKSRSGQQWDIWEAVYSPVGADGYPRRIWDKRTGVIDPEVAAYWRDHYDLSAILRRDWEQGLGEKLAARSTCTSATWTTTT